MACVYRRGDNYWVRFTWRGEEFRRSARTSVRATAQQFLAHTLEEQRKLDRGGRVRRTWSEAIERFSIDHMPSLKPMTQKRYRTSFRQQQPIFGSLYIDDINKMRLAEFVSERRKCGASNATIRRDIAALSIVMSCAVEWDWTEINPAKAFNKRQLREAPPRTTYPSDAEIARLIENATPMAGRIVALLAETGMRMEEACSLEWSQVSLPRREIRLTKTKTSAPRIVPLSDDALGTILGTPRHITGPYVFWHDDGQRYTQFSGYFRRLAKRAKVASRCHDLRHRFASVFLQRTGDLPALQRILGHKTIAMTMRYSHLLTDHLHDAVRKFDQSVGTKVGTSTAVSDCPNEGQQGISA